MDREGYRCGYARRPFLNGEDASRGEGEAGMKAAGMFLLLTGWAITLSSVALFAQGALRSVFILVGFSLELGGLTMAFRTFHGGAKARRESE